MSTRATVATPIRTALMAGLAMIVVASCGGGSNTTADGKQTGDETDTTDQGSPWTAYIGAHYALTPNSGLTRNWAGGGLRDPGGIGTNYEPVANAQGGYDDPAYASFTTKALPQLDTLLQQGRQAVVSLAVGGSPEFLSSMGTAAGRSAYRKAIDDRIGAIGSLPHAAGWEQKIRFQFGNEITNVNPTGFYGRVCLWVTANATANCDLATQFTPAYVEEFLAPGIEALQAQSQSLFGKPDGIHIMLGSIVNLARKQDFANTLLNYQIQGTRAPTLAGRKVHELVDAVSIHYTMMDPDYLAALDTFRNDWVPNGVPRSRVRALWSTEELGQNAASQGFGMATALRALARYLAYWERNSITPDDGHMFFWGSDIGSCTDCTSLDADMHYLHDFTGDAALKAAVVGAKATGIGAIELHDFVVAGQDKRVIAAFMRDQADGSLASLAIDLGTWSGKQATVTAYRFAGKGAEPLAVTPTSVAASATTTVAIPTALGQRDTVLILIAAQP